MLRGAASTLRSRWLASCSVAEIANQSSRISQAYSIPSHCTSIWGKSWSQCHVPCLIAHQSPVALSGAGFFIGDGAGVGKGRQIAGIMLDNYARGRRRHIWLSTSSDLHLDAQRDLRNIGCHINVINNCQTLDKEQKVVGLPKDLQEGVLFMCVPVLFGPELLPMHLQNTFSSSINLLSYEW